jgi:hypothetical protein
MQMDLLHGVGDVGHVKVRYWNAPKLGSFLKRRPRVYSELHLEVDRSLAWLIVSHGHTLDDVQRVGALVEEHPI